MIGDLLPAMFVDMAIVLVPLSAAALCYLWLRQRDTVAMLASVERVGLHFSQYAPVHGGSLLHDYFDADLFLCEPQNIDRSLQWLKEELDNQREAGSSIDRLVFIEKREGPVGALTLKDLVSRETRIPTALLRPRRRGPAPRVKGLVDGKEPLTRFDQTGKPERVAIISDVGTTGTTILEAVEMVQSAGGSAEIAFVLYDRGEGATQALKQRGVQLYSMARSSDVPHRTSETADTLVGAAGR